MKPEEQQFLSGLDAEKRFAEAVDYLERLANLDDAEAQRLIAGYYLRGQGAPRSQDAAFRWLARALDLGDYLAGYELAHAFDPRVTNVTDAADTRKDADRAFRYYQRAYVLCVDRATAGDSAAQSYLGTMHQCGWGRGIDSQEAVRWYIKAFDGGVHISANNLAGLFFDGAPDLPADVERAKYWYQAAQGAGCRFISIPELD